MAPSRRKKTRAQEKETADEKMEKAGATKVYKGDLLLLLIVCIVQFLKYCSIPQTNTANHSVYRF